MIKRDPVFELRYDSLSDLYFSIASRIILSKPVTGAKFAIIFHKFCPRKLGYLVFWFPYHMFLILNRISGRAAW